MPAWKNREAGRRRHARYAGDEPNDAFYADDYATARPQRASRTDLDRIERLTRTATAMPRGYAGQAEDGNELEAVAGELDRLLAAREQGPRKKSQESDPRRAARQPRPSGHQKRRSARDERDNRLDDVMGALDRLDRKMVDFADSDEFEGDPHGFEATEEERFDRRADEYDPGFAYADGNYDDPEDGYGHDDDLDAPLSGRDIADMARPARERPSEGRGRRRERRPEPAARRQDASMHIYKDLGRRIEALRQPQEEAFDQVRQELGSLRDALGGYTRGTGEKVNRQNAELRRLSHMIERLQADRKGDLLAKEMRKEIADLKAMVARTNVEGPLHTLEHGYAHILQRLDELSRAAIDPRALHGLTSRLSEIEEAFAALPRGEHVVVLEDRIADIASRMEQLLQRKSHSEIEPLRGELQTLRQFVEQIDITSVIEGIDDRMQFVSGRLDDLEQLAREQQGLDSRLSAMEERMPAPDTINRLQGRLEDIVSMMSDDRAHGDANTDISRVDSRLDEIADRLDAITGKMESIERKAESSASAALVSGDGIDTRLLSEMQVRLNTLTEQLEQPKDTVTTDDLDKLRQEIGAMRASVSAPASTEGLEQRISDLAQAVERSGEGLDDNRFDQLGAKVAALAEQLEATAYRSDGMGEVTTALGRIETGLQDTRLEVVDIAKAAAREAVAGASVGSGQYDRDIQALQADLRRLLDNAEGSDERTRNTFDGMQSVLESVTDRLERLERADVAPNKGPATLIQGLVDQDAGDENVARGTFARANPVQERPAERVRDRKADFIAAARRAAQAASREAEQLEAEAGLVEEPADADEQRVGWLGKVLKRGRKPKAEPEENADAAISAEEVEPVQAEDEPITVLAGDRPAPEETEASGGGRRRMLLFTAAALVLAIGAMQIFKMATGGSEEKQIAVTTEEPAITQPQVAEVKPASLPKAESKAKPSTAQPAGDAAGEKQAPSKRVVETAPASGPVKRVTAPQTDRSAVTATVPATARPEVSAPVPEPTASAPAAPDAASEKPGQDLAFAPPETVNGTFADGVAQPGAQFGTPAETAAPAKQNVSLVSSLPPEEIGPMALRSAAAGGNPAAAFLVGVKYTEGEGVAADLAEAAKWYQKAAVQGLAPAQYRLASLYEKGRGVEKDIDKARAWYTKAAEAGNPKAMHNLAVLYAEGSGGAPDFTNAAKWFEDAANHGIKDSLFNLGILYARGLGVEKNLEASYKWFAVAAEQGDRDAAKKRDEVANMMDQAGLAAARLSVENFKIMVPDPAATKVATDPEWASAGISATDASALAGSSVDYTAMVRQAQTQLNALGFDTGTPDGAIGPRTRSAVKAFQRSLGQKETGVIDADLLKELDSQSI
jgi:localization factor PodJL